MLAPSNVETLMVIAKYVSPDDGFPVEGFLPILGLVSDPAESILDIVVGYLRVERLQS